MRGRWRPGAFPTQDVQHLFEHKRRGDSGMGGPTIRSAPERRFPLGRRQRMNFWSEPIRRLCVAPRVKHSRVVVCWREGLHLRHAAAVVRAASKFRSTVHLKCGGRIANLRSILSVLALCATMGTALDLEVSGDDEQDATVAIEQIFSGHDGGDVVTDVTGKRM